MITNILSSVSISLLAVGAITTGSSAHSIQNTFIDSISIEEDGGESTENPKIRTLSTNQDEEQEEGLLQITTTSVEVDPGTPPTPTLFQDEEQEEGLPQVTTTSVEVDPGSPPIPTLFEESAVSNLSTFDKETNLTGVIVKIDLDANSDNGSINLIDDVGTMYTLGIDLETEFGLEDKAGAHWNEKYGNDKVESVQRVVDQQRRFSPVTVVVSAEGVVLTMTESAPRNLDTNLVYLGSAYIALIVGVLIYLFFISRKVASLNSKIRLLQNKDQT